jgi:hypothetical protein
VTFIDQRKEHRSERVHFSSLCPHEQELELDGFCCTLLKLKTPVEVTFSNCEITGQARGSRRE